MRRLPALLCLLLALGTSPTGAAEAFTIGFGSCLRQEDPQPVWEGVRAIAPDVFVFGGDNVYTDAGLYRLRPEPERIGTAYRRLAEEPGFAALRAGTPLYATWDDHDYGANDAGADYPHKGASKTYFMDFFGIPADSPLRAREGVYDAHWPGGRERGIQLLLLDTRSFRAPLVVEPTDAACPHRRFGRNEDPAATVLGTAQWAWLAGRLAEPATLHVVVSSIQAIPEEHCFEKWANFPRERERLLGLLASASAPVLLLSGDRHLAEISRLQRSGWRHPLLELTSSGMNSAYEGKPEANRHRALPVAIRADNFATVSVSGAAGSLRLSLAIRGTDGRVLQSLETSYPAR